MGLYSVAIFFIMVKLYVVIKLCKIVINLTCILLESR